MVYYETRKVDPVVFEFAVKLARLKRADGFVSKKAVDDFLAQKANERIKPYIADAETAGSGTDRADSVCDVGPVGVDGDPACRTDNPLGVSAGVGPVVRSAALADEKRADTRCVFIDAKEKAGKVDYAFIQRFSEHHAGWHKVGCLPLGCGLRKGADGRFGKCVWVLATDPRNKEQDADKGSFWRLSRQKGRDASADRAGGTVEGRTADDVSADGSLAPWVVSHVMVWLGDEVLRGSDLVFIFENRAVIEIGLDEFYVKEQLDQQEVKQTAKNGAGGGKDESAITFIDAKPVPEIDKVAVERAQSWLRNAINRDATDIHIEPVEGGGRVRLRIDGSLVEAEASVRPYLLRQICSWLKVQADVDITEMRRPLDGKMMLARMVDGKRFDVDVRFSSIPTIYGEKVVLRLLDKSKQDERYEKQGGLEGLFPPDRNGKWLYSFFEEALRYDNGIVLVTGPTGCGKTTTLNASLRYILENDHNQSNIVTVEDPVEYTMKGANQVQTNDLAGLTFANALRSILRQDPDIVLVGEIRDEETASVAVQAALTGHLILSTLHTNDAVGCVERLADLKVSPFLVGSTVRLFQAQRLIKLLCPWKSEKEPGCSVALSKEAARQRILRSRLARYIDRFAGKGIRMANEAGCPSCGSQSHGYKGRRAVMEVIPMRPELRAAIQAGCPRDELMKLARAHCGLRSMVECGLDLLVEDSESGPPESGRVYPRTDVPQVEDLEMGDS